MSIPSLLRIRKELKNLFSESSYKSAAVDLIDDFIIRKHKLANYQSRTASENTKILQVKNQPTIRYSRPCGYRAKGKAVKIEHAVSDFKAALKRQEEIVA